MQSYVVFYRQDEQLLAPLAFQCHADDVEHAKEQCLNAEPDVDIVWVVATDDVNTAYTEYWNNPERFIADK